ncbi:MAG: sulfatase-like hydrolase/transferase [Planctomycetota bacterium]
MSTTAPNILIFMTDQQRGSTILPEHLAKTPHLDRFLAEGLLFDNTRCPSPHCCPSRATFFTGLYPTEHGVWNNVSVQNAHSRGLNEGVQLWSERLVEAGYRCAFSGKWHVDFDRAPRDFGWEELRVTAGTVKDGCGWMGPDWEAYRGGHGRESADERADGQVLRPGYGDYQHYGSNENPFGDREVVDAGLASLRQMAGGEKPWCLYVGTLGPHDPYVPPQRFIDMYRDVDIPLPDNFDDPMTDKPALYRRTRGPFDQLSREEHRESIRRYLAFCSYQDALFGEVLAELERSDQADNTLVIYTSDHGDYLGEHGLWCKGLPNFRGAYEVPLAMRWPAGLQEPGRRCDAKVGLEDLARTLLEVTGNAAAVDWPGSGRSLLPFIHNQEPASWRNAFFTQTNGNELYGIQRSIDTGEWKYTYNGFDDDELYDLRKDPGEVHNLAADPQYAGQVQELCARMWAFAYEHQDQCINPYVMVALAPVGPGAAFDSQGRPIASGG